MKIKQTILLIISILAISHTLFASDNAGAFIEKGLQARSSGMGMSYVSVANNSDAIYWNPACLSRVTRSDASIMGSKAYETDYLSFQYATQYNDIGIGFGYVRAAMQGIYETVLGQSGRYSRTGNELSYNANAYYLGAGKQITDTLSLGLTTKIITEEAAQYKASGFGFDIGALYQPIEQIAIGINFQNLIKPSMTWNTPSGNIDTIPNNLKAGISFMPFKQLLLSCDVNIRNNRDNKLNFGCEYWLTEFLPLRAGFDENRLSLGTGLYIDMLYLNFAWINPELDQIDDIYRFSLGVNF